MRKLKELTILFAILLIIAFLSDFSIGGYSRKSIDYLARKIQSIKTYVDYKLSIDVNEIYTEIEGPNNYAFKTITGITNDVVADSSTDTLTLSSANARLTIAGTTATDTVTFTADTDLHNYSWTSVDGTDLKTGSVTQAYGAILDDLNTLGAPASDGQFIVATGAGAFQYETGDTVLASVGLSANLGDLTDNEAAQIEFIGATTISANQWTAIGSMAETLTGAELNVLDGIAGLATPSDGDTTHLSNADQIYDWVTGLGLGGLTQEQVDDYVYALLNDAESIHTLITITYDDTNDAYNFVVDDDLSSYDNSSSAFLVAETDPCFAIAPANDITTANKTNWTAGYNDKINSAAFNTSDGVITLTQQDAGTVTVDIDGRYEPTVTKGNLTATSPIALDQTRQVIGGAAVISIADAAADGSTKGAASFNATRFSAASGIIDIASVSGITGADEDSVSAADLGAASANIDTDGTIEWEDAADLDSDGGLSNDTVAVAEFLGSQDWGDMSTAADGIVTLDANIIAANELAAGDYGEITIDNVGGITIDADSIALTTDTTGNYVASITNGAGISGGDGGSEAAALTLAATLGTAIDTTEITDDTIEIVDFNMLNTPADEDIVVYDTATGGGFKGLSTAEVLGTGNSTSLSDTADLLYEAELDDESELETQITDMGNILQETEIDTSSELLTIMDDETGSAAGTPLLVFNTNPVLTGATLAGILADNDDMVFEIDADNDGDNKYSFTDGASAEVVSITETGLIVTAGDLRVDQLYFDDSWGTIGFGAERTTGVWKYSRTGVPYLIVLNNTNNTLLFQTYASGPDGNSLPSPEVVLVIDGDKVGINTTLPEKDLHVVDEIRVSYQEGFANERIDLFALEVGGGINIRDVNANVVISLDSRPTALCSFQNTGGVNVGGAASPGDNNIYIVGDCSALTFTDRPASYAGDALVDIKKIKIKNGKIDYNTLPESVKSRIKLKRYNEETDETTETIEEGRNLGNAVSMLTAAVQQLLERIEELEKREN